MRSQLFKRNTNVIVQGITGKHGAFHTKQMIQAGTSIVAGTSPGKAGERIHGIPVFDSIAAIQEEMRVDTSVVFVPAPFAKAALLEAIDAKVPLIVCITEGIPIHDMLEVKQRANAAGTTLIGPNCPGVLLPGVLKLGIIPTHMGTPGNVGIVSRSGTLTYEAAASLTARGIGQKYIIGIGGDRIRGTDFIDCLALFEKDPDVTSIVLIGEIGGNGEQRAAEYIRAHVTKPVYTYIAGHAAPAGIQLGHAGAILNSTEQSAVAKTKLLREASALTSDSITELVDTVR
ncbi:MAG TPA: succinate--CoA ligase subunit alpha [Candidatus Saccharimonadales bacterium]|nr:succinate--CoA ligase subunit alpha [Candidatus Saccharimonadales bacterium]